MMLSSVDVIDLLLYKMLILKCFLHRIFISGTRVVKNYPGSELPPTGTRVPVAALPAALNSLSQVHKIANTTEFNSSTRVLEVT